MPLHQSHGPQTREAATVGVYLRAGAVPGGGYDPAGGERSRREAVDQLQPEAAAGPGHQHGAAAPERRGAAHRRVTGI